MSQGADNPVVPATLPRLGLVIVALALAFYCTEHNLFISKMEMFGTTQEDLEKNAAGGKLANQLGFSLVALVGVVLLAQGRRRWRFDGLLPVLLPLFIGWCLTTAVWSTDPSRTVKRVGIMVLCFVGALGAGRRLRPRDLCVLALSATATYAAIGLGAELALGTLKPSAEYRFAGTLHPNGQGANCALLCLSAVCLLAAGSRHKGLLIALLMFGAGLLILTKSRTACAALLGGLLALRCLRPSPRVVGAGLVTAWGVGLLALLAVMAEVDFKEGAGVLLLGRVEHVGTLTGRTELWPELMPFVEDRLIRGHGYGAFWSADRVEEVSSTVFWGLSSAHSVYLDAVLGFGLVGAGVLALIVLAGLVRAGRLYRATCDLGYALMFALLVYGLLDGIAESDFLAPSFVPFIAGCGLAHLAYFRPARAQGEC
jgi:O-antigen ligase